MLSTAVCAEGRCLAPSLRLSPSSAPVGALARALRRAFVAVLFATFLSCVFAWPIAARADTGGASSKPDDKVSIDESESSVTGSLQGKEGVRIQTMCTHCNSANIQVGGLNQ